MPAYDLIIRNGTVVDGTGAPRFTGDVAIKDGLIAQVGTVRGDAAEEIDAAGMIVTPGFVDIHTHYDGQATWDPEMAPSSWHGVTTVVCRGGGRASMTSPAATPSTTWPSPWCASCNPGPGAGRISRGSANRGRPAPRGPRSRRSAARRKASASTTASSCSAARRARNPGTRSVDAVRWHRWLAPFVDTVR
ncbi:amidohydrolase family protein [Leptolyngbya sp. 15MV]|nr:amidohydrolase family protein [Leptolyngbya sp. 15MV]